MNASSGFPIELKIRPTDQVGPPVELPTVMNGWRLRQSLGIFSEKEFAAAMGVGKSTLATWRQKKIGPTYGKIGKTVFYRVDDIRQWMAQSVAYRTS